MSGKKLVLESRQQCLIGGEVHTAKEDTAELLSFIEVSKENVFKKTERLSAGNANAVRVENRDDVQGDLLSGQAKIINQVCAALLKILALFFTIAITIAILQALFL